MATVEALRRRARGVSRLVVTELSGFGVVGGTCFLLDIGLFQLLYTRTGAGAVLAKLVSTLVATVVAYAGNRYWSFAHRARTGMRRELPLFLLINGVTLVLGLAVVALVRHGLGQESALVLQVANVGSIAVGTLIRYVAYRRWVFPAQPLEAPRSAAPADSASAA